MTTIVIDRKLRIMAADKQITCADGCILRTTKISRVTYYGSQALVACAGSAEAAVAFLLWLEDQEKERLGQKTDGKHKDVHYPQRDDFHAVLLHENGEVQWFGPKGYPMAVVERWHGIGSGSSYALGALHAGADIRTAIKIACKLDSQSGCGIQVEGFTQEKKRKRGKRSG